MKTFSQYREEYIDTVTFDLGASGRANVELFHDPTPSEFRELVRERRMQSDVFRFIATYNGDIYAINTHEQSIILHIDILDVLRKQGILSASMTWASTSKSLKSFAAFTYHQKAGRFYAFSESYDPYVKNYLEKNPEIVEHYSKILSRKMLDRELKIDGEL